MSDKENPGTDLMVQSANEAAANLPSTSVFADERAFKLAQRVATMLSQSQLVPKEYAGEKGLPNCMIALEMAGRIGASPLMVMQNLYIVHGKPGWASQFLVATLNASGRFTELSYEEDGQDGGRCRAHATSRVTGEVKHGVWVSMGMAKAEGWIDKAGSKWKTMPALMLRYRAATFFVRQFAPELAMGIATAEEVYDVGPAHRDGPSSRLTLTDTEILRTAKPVEVVTPEPEPVKLPVKPEPEGEF